MKVNVFVAAAMVITSVSASGDGGLLRCLGRICGSGESQEPTKPNPKCAPLLLELASLWADIDAFNCRSETQDERFFKLVTGQNTGEISDGLGVGNDRKGGEGVLRAAAIQKHIKSNPGDIPRLREIQAESLSLEKNYREIWAKLKKSKCVTKELKRTSSPKNMEKEGNFPKWKDAKGKDIFRKQ
ncbi:hypothetical protein BASA50_006464 [Batrachochytrium salamandrivorans]|uniref:Uncharacterized protein n=1 Tax=Batrachochytrium salamandrivorans TaxID=1357716 RepID=A0ABQ8FCR0_9FUNG|nr:hypothetical protein BASA50_006464 [Batrachochytrium salamandrivorans]